MNNQKERITSNILPEKEVDISILEYSSTSGFEGNILQRDDFEEWVDEPCRESCLNLYDKNIRTIASNGNETYAKLRNERGLYISLEYNSLSDENKKIADDLQKRGLVEISHPDSEVGLIGPKVIIRTLLKPTHPGGRLKFKNKSLSIVDTFQPQDVYYGRFSGEEVVAQILDTLKIGNKEVAKEFLLQNKILNQDDTINPHGIIELLSTKKDSIRVKDPQVSYRVITFGKIYDQETDEFWANEELLQKHRDFIASKKTLRKSILAIPFSKPPSKRGLNYLLKIN